MCVLQVSLVHNMLQVACENIVVLLEHRGNTQGSKPCKNSSCMHQIDHDDYVTGYPSSTAEVLMD